MLWHSPRHTGSSRSLLTVLPPKVASETAVLRSSSLSRNTILSRSGVRLRRSSQTPDMISRNCPRGHVTSPRYTRTSRLTHTSSSHSSSAPSVLSSSMSPYDARALPESGRDSVNATPPRTLAVYEILGRSASSGVVVYGKTASRRGVSVSTSTIAHRRALLSRSQAINSLSVMDYLILSSQFDWLIASASRSLERSDA